MDSIRKKQIVRVVCIIVASAVGCPMLVHFGRIYGPIAWNNLHLVNFVVAWIPAVLSILVAFIPDKDLEKRVRVGWRILVIICGVLYSIFLWHQQTLTDKSNAASQKEAIDNAVARANAHSDEQFKKVQENVGGVEKQVTGLGQSLSSALEKSTSELSSGLGKVGKPDPPIPAKLTFSLWDLAATIDKPALSKTVEPDNEGNFPVDFGLINGSESTADTIDIWIQVCDLCSFAKEPTGFEHPTGGDERIRHRMIGSLNPGAAFEKMTILIKSSRPNPFQIAFRYSCKTCGGKLSANQVATITQGASLTPKPQ